MKFHRGFIFPAIFGLGVLLSSGAAQAAQSFTVQGRILNADGTPLAAAAVPFRVQVRSAGVENCLLYEETQTLNLAVNQGAFALTVGQGTRVAAGVDGGNSIDKIFSNSSAISLAAATTPCSGGATSFTPGIGDGRSLVLSYFDGTAWDTAPVIALNWVPQAMYAQNADKLGGILAAQYVNSSNLPTCAGGTVLTWNGTAFSCVAGGGGGGSGTVTSVTSANADIGVATTTTTPVLTLNTGIAASQILKLDGSAKIPAVDGSLLTSLNPANLSSAVAVNKGGTGQTTYSDGQLLIGNSSGSTLTKATLTAGTGISVTNGNGSISIAATGLANTLADGKIFVGQSGTPTAVAVTGDLAMTNAGVTTVNAVKGKTVSAAPTAAGQMLRYDGTNWTPNYVSMFDLRSTVTGSSSFGGVGCTAGQTLTWTAASDNLVCTNISISGAQVAYGSQTANTVLAAPNGSAGAPTFRALVSADLPSGSLAGSGTAGYIPYYSAAATLANSPVFVSGSAVGIGTTSPGYIFDVAGTGRFTGLLRAQNGNGTGAIRIGADVNATTLTANTRKVARIVAPTYDNTSADVLAFASDNDGTDNGIFYGGYPTSTTVTAATKLHFLTASALNTTGGTERMTIDGSGNVGIGTTSPASIFQVSASAPVFTLTDSATTSYSSFTQNNGTMTVRSNAATGQPGLIDISPTVTDGTSAAQVRMFRTTNTSGGKAFYLFHGDGTSTVDSQFGVAGTSTYINTGNVGIGTTAPAVTFEVVGSSDTSGIQIRRNSASTSSAAILSFRNATSESATNSSQISSIRLNSPNSSDTALALSVTSAGILTEVVRVDSTAKVGIGNTAPAEKLHVTGNIKASGSIYSGSQTVTGGTSSVDWANGNSIATDYNCGSTMDFVNLADGGTYTLAITDTGTTQCNFSTTTTGTGAGTVTYKFRPANAARSGTGHTLYTLMRVGSVVYISWASGFQ